MGEVLIHGQQAGPLGWLRSPQCLARDATLSLHLHRPSLCLASRIL